MKYKAPENAGGISIGGEWYQVGEDGCITLPDEGDFSGLIPHGYVQVQETEQTARTRKKTEQ